MSIQEYLKFIPPLSNVDKLVKEPHVKELKAIMFYWVLHFIKLRKKQNNIKHNSPADVFPTDVYEHLPNYTQDTKNKRTTQLNPDKHKKPDAKPSTSKTVPKLKMPINIQSNWVYSLIYFELCMFKEAVEWSKKSTKIELLHKVSEKHNSVYKFIRTVSELNIDDGKDDDVPKFITDKTENICKKYKQILTGKKKDILAEHLADTFLDFIRILASHAETTVWFTLRSKSCNYGHFMLTLDLLSKQTNIKLNINLIDSVDGYVGDRSAKKTLDDKLLQIEESQVKLNQDKKDILAKKKKQEEDLSNSKPKGKSKGKQNIKKSNSSTDLTTGNSDNDASEPEDFDGEDYDAED